MVLEQNSGSVELCDGELRTSSRECVTLTGHRCESVAGAPWVKDSRPWIWPGLLAQLTVAIKAVSLLELFLPKMGWRSDIAVADQDFLSGFDVLQGDDGQLL